MNLRITAGLITAGIITIAIGVGSLAVFAPEVFALLVGGGILSGIAYHLYCHILYNLKKAVDSKRDSV